MKGWQKIAVLVLVQIVSLSLLQTRETCAMDTMAVLRVYAGKPNPKGNIERLFLFKGNMSDGNVVIDESLVKLPKAQLKNGEERRLRVFHFNDMHGNLEKENVKGNTYHFAQMVQRVNEAKRERNPHDVFLFVSAGDDHIGTKFDELLGDNKQNFIKSVPYEVYSEGGVDFSCVGNHELDKFTPILNMAITQNARFPVMSSNIVDSSYEPAYYPAAIAVVGGVRVGVLGLTNPNETRLQTKVDPKLRAIEPQIVISKLIPVLDKHVDIFLVLSHLGYDGDKGRYSLHYGDTNVAKQINMLTKKKAIIVGAHTHSVLNKDGLEHSNRLGKVVIVQAGQYGSFLGEIDVELKKDDVVQAKVDRALLYPVIPGHSKDPQAQLQKSKDYDKELQEGVIVPARRLADAHLGAFIAKTSSEEGVSVKSNETERYIGESAMANFINDAIVRRSESFVTGKVDFSLLNATGVNGLPMNQNISLSNMYQLFPYADTISVVKMSGKEIKDIVENNAKRVYGKKEMLSGGGRLNPADFLERGYIHFSKGIRYVVRRGKTQKDNKVLELTLFGKKINDLLDKEYNVAVGSYLAIGRGSWNGEAIGQGLPESVKGYNLKKICQDRQIDTGLVYRNELIEYMKEVGVVDAKSGVAKDGRVIVE